MKQIRKEVYLATLQNGQRIMVIPEERPEWDSSLSEKKRVIIDDLNRKLDGKVTSITFYGTAEIEKAGRYSHTKDEDKS